MRCMPPIAMWEEKRTARRCPRSPFRLSSFFFFVFFGAAAWATVCIYVSLRLHICIRWRERPLLRLAIEQTDIEKGL